MCGDNEGEYHLTAYVRVKHRRWKTFSHPQADAVFDSTHGAVNSSDLMYRSTELDKCGRWMLRLTAEPGIYMLRGGLKHASRARPSTLLHNLS